MCVLGFRSKMERLVEVNTQYKGANRLTKHLRRRGAVALRCIISRRSAEAKEDRKKAVQALKMDITNLPEHMLGNHVRCGDYCKSKKDIMGEEEKRVEGKEVDTEFEDILQENEEIWKDLENLELQAEALSIPSMLPTAIDDQIKKHLRQILEPIKNKANVLIENSTSNLAEHYMSIRTKMDGGKRVNRTGGSSWTTRCAGAALQQNLGTFWSTRTWETVTGEPPSPPFKKWYGKVEQRNQHSRKSKCKPEVKARAYKRKAQSQSQGKSKKAKMFYGQESIQVTEDVSCEELKKMCTDYYMKEVEVTPEKKKVIERLTKLQGQSGVWHSERKKRITASNVGKVAKRNPKIRVEPLVRDMLHSTFKGNSCTLNGLKLEEKSLKGYKALMENQNPGQTFTLSKAGLFISPTSPWLGASPDGLVNVTNENEEIEKGIVEVKQVLYKKNVTFQQAATDAKISKTFCLERTSSGKLMLKRTHNYYYQCQTQLAVTGAEWLDFVVNCDDPPQMHVERITLDTKFWDEILPKLETFYRKALLPELACPRHGKSPGIREPGMWVSVIEYFKNE